MPGLEGRGVLIVEDDEEILKLLAFILESECSRVFPAQDGAGALEVLQSHGEEIVLIITDLGLPQLGGIDLIARARTLQPSLKIIGISGLGARNVQTMALKAGANRFIPKPFTVDQVIATIHEIMDVE